MPSANGSSGGQPPERPSAWKRYGRLIAVGLAIVALFAASRLLRLDEWLQELDDWVRSLGAWGPLAFGAIYVIAALLFVPGSVLTLAAGAIFGLWLGLLVVSLAATTAAVLAFVIARFFARQRLEHLAERYPKFGAIDRAIGEQGWKIVGLLRLSPAIPYSISNYLFGLTAVGTLPYVLATWVGMLPGGFLYIYLGHIGRAGLKAAAEGESERTTAEWVMLAVGLLATVVVTVLVTRIARRAVREQTEIEEAGEPAGVRESALQ